MPDHLYGKRSTKQKSLSTICYAALLAFSITAQARAQTAWTGGDIPAGEERFNAGNINIIINSPQISGTLNNNSGGVVNNFRTINNDGAINNNNGARINNFLNLNNDGALLNAAGGTLINEDPGTLTNNNTLENRGVLTNDGTLNNNGQLDNFSDIANSLNATLANDDTLTNNVGGTLTNFGALTNNASGAFRNDGDLINEADGVFNNNGFIDNNSSLTNDGAFNNSRQLDNSGNLTNNLGATLTNNDTVTNSAGGTLTNFGVLTNDGALTNNAGATVTNNGTLSGGGTLTNMGMLTNIGDIAQTLVNQPGGAVTATGGITGDIENAGAFTVSGPLTLNGGAFANMPGGNLNIGGATVSGTSRLENNGAVVIDAGGTVSLAAFETSGSLINNGAVFGDVLASGGEISGAGVFTGDLTALTGSAIAPGNSIGVIAVDGDLSLENGSTLIAEITDGAADQIAVAGNVNIDGANLILRDLAGATPSQDNMASFILIDNDGADAITGAGFASITDDLAFLDPIVTLTGGDGNDVSLSFEIPVVLDLESIAATPVQLETARALDVVLAADESGARNAAAQALFDAFTPLTTAQATLALRMAGGGVHPAVQFEAGADAFRFADAVGDTQSRAAAKGAPWNASFRFIYADIDTDADSFGGEATDSNAVGAVGFLDRKITDTLRLGGGLRYVSGETDSFAGRADRDSFGYALSAVYQRSGFALKSVVGQTRGEASVTRDVTVGALNNQFQTDYDLTASFVRIEAQYDAAFGATTISPYASWALVRTRRDAFSETGGALALSGAENTDNFGSAQGGVELSHKVTIGGVDLQPAVRVGYERLLNEARPDQTLSFNGAANSFTAFSASHSRDRLRYGATLTAGFAKNVRGFMDFDGVTSDSDQEYRVRGGIRVNF